MAPPNVSMTIRDFGLGIVGPSSGKTQVKLGVCTKGTPNEVYSGSKKALQEALGAGPLLEAAVQALSIPNAGPVLAVPINPTTYGTVGAFALTGSGAATITGGKGPKEVVTIKIILGGAAGTATFQTKVGSGQYSSTVTTNASTPWSYPVPGAYLTTAVFAAGTYVANDTYTLNLDGTVTRVGSGTATLLDGSTHSPVDSYDLWIKIMTAGAPGTGAFAYSLDGGNNFGGTLAIPAAGKYVVPETGLVLTFSGTFVKDDLYKSSVTGASYSNSDVTNALVALIASPNNWRWAHVIGKPSSAAAAASLAAAVDTQMTAAEAAHKYVFGVTECPQDLVTDTDTVIKTAFAAFESRRTMVCVADVGLISPMTGRTERRPFGWAVTARMGATKMSIDPAQKDLGGLNNVDSLYRDEEQTPGLEEFGFTVARRFGSDTGYYVTSGRIKAPAGSDYSYVTNRRVMDELCSVAYAAYLLYINKAIDIDVESGFIDEAQAQEIDGVVKGKLETAVIDTDEASGVSAVLSREDNVLSTGTLNAEVGCIPKGYARNINVTLGFVNPALRRAA